MNKFYTTSLLTTLLLLIFTGCSKEGTEVPVVDPQLVVEQDAAEQYAYANSLLNEIFVISFREAIRNPELFGLTGQPDRAEDRGGCPETTLIKGTNSNTLIIDFGTGCQLGGPNGPTVAGTLTCISEGPYNTNAKQIVDFDNITINGYQVLNNSAPGAPGICFINSTPSPHPPFEYNFKSYITPGTTFKVINPAGEKTVVEPITSPRSFACFTIVDNDPPLTPDFADLLDAEFQIAIEKLRMTQYTMEGTIDHYVISPVPGKPLILSMDCRFFKGGSIGIWGAVEQCIDYGWDPVLGSDPVPGDGCDGVAKIKSTVDAEGCRFIRCP